MAYCFLQMAVHFYLKVLLYYGITFIVAMYLKSILIFFWFVELSLIHVDYIFITTLILYKHLQSIIYPQK